MLRLSGLPLGCSCRVGRVFAKPQNPADGALMEAGWISSSTR